VCARAAPSSTESGKHSSASGANDVHFHVQSRCSTDGLFRHVENAGNSGCWSSSDLYDDSWVHDYDYVARD